MRKKNKNKKKKKRSWWAELRVKHDLQGVRNRLDWVVHDPWERKKERKVEGVASTWYIHTHTCREQLYPAKVMELLGKEKWTFSSLFFSSFFGLSQLRENRRRGAWKKKPEMANQMVCRDMMRNLLVLHTQTISFDLNAFTIWRKGRRANVCRMTFLLSLTPICRTGSLKYPHIFSKRYGQQISQKTGLIK